MSDDTTRLSWATAINAAGLTLLGIIALFTMETTTPNYDPQFMRVLVERTARYGGSYYSNGIHNKGPLEPFVYSLANHIGGFDGFWFVIAIFTMLAAIAIALAGAAIVVIDDGSRATIAIVTAVIVAHFTISGADYSGVLYARNISVALLSIAFVVGVSARAWSTERRRNASVLIIGVAIGLAVQTLITAAFTGGAVLVWAMWWRRRRHALRMPAWAALPLVAAATFFSAPLYYRVFGPWNDFVDGFWTHARFMSAGTGRGLFNQFGLGWTNLTSYYGDRPFILLGLVAWLVLAIATWRRASPLQRSVRLLLLAWWLGAWIELVLSQRYSSHYFSVLAVPSVLMATDLATSAIGYLARWFEPRPWARVLPIVLAIATIFAGKPRAIDAGIEAAATVRSTSEFTERREANFPTRIRTTRSALDLVSADGDPLLMWTNYPWPYLDLHRVSATRFIWKSFMVGEIYLGSTSEEFVLPSTWSDFADDLAESDPPAYLVETVTPLQADTPFASYVEENFSIVYQDDDETLSFRNDLFDQLAASPTNPRPVTAGTATEGCERVDGILAPDVASVIEIVSADGESVRQIKVTAQDNSVIASVAGVADSETQVPTSGPARFSLIAGARSTVLMVEGRIAVALPSSVDSTVLWRSAATTGSLTVSDAPAFTGCDPT